MSGFLRPSLLRSHIFDRIWPLSSPLGLTTVKSSGVPHNTPTPLLRIAQAPSPCPITSQHHLPKPDKWGTVIYRCTYKDDQAWNNFKQKLQAETDETRAFYKRTTEPITENHEWKFVEDPASFDGATKDQLRARFREWRAQAAPKDLPCFDDDKPVYGSQYQYFIQVDEQSLKDFQDWGLDGCSVNLIDADWLPMRERWPNEKYDDDDDEFAYDPVKGCTEEHVGWMMISGSAIDARLWGEEMDSTLWYVYYRRPDDVLYH